MFVIKDAKVHPDVITIKKIISFVPSKKNMSKKSDKPRQRNNPAGKFRATNPPVSPNVAVLNSGEHGAGFFNKPVYLLAILLLLTFFAFFPSLRNGYMPTWDDDKYVVNNPLVKELNLNSVAKMFTRPVNGSYVPLPLLTFSLEQQFFGDNPFPRHLTNLLLHLLCTALVFQILRMLKINLLYAAFGALLFGIHPMRVESVAWISERKDVLYSLFYLASMLFYIRHLQKQDEGSRNRTLSYIFFILALFSKIEAVTLPLCLLLIDFYSKRPLKLRLIVEKIPYFILSLLFGILGIYIIYRVGLKSEAFLAGNVDIRFTDRIFYAFYTISWYIIKFFAPFSLSAWYPYPHFEGFSKILFYIVNPVVIATAAFLAYRFRHRWPAIIFGILFFLVNIMFLLQIFSVGIAFSADRYTYIAYIGFIFMVVWSAGHVSKSYREWHAPMITALSLFSLMCLFVTNARCRDWYDGESLWSDVINKYPDKEALPYVNRGVAYTMAARWPEALQDLNKALAIDKDCKAVYPNRAIVYGNMGQPELAIADFSKTIEAEPANANAMFNRGVSYVNAGKYAEAIEDFSKTIAIKPDYLAAYINLGILSFCCTRPQPHCRRLLF
jgi:tetratricopeptide (TPR) repeat protein